MSIPIIKTFPFLKHYRRKSDDLKQVIIRARISYHQSNLQKIQKTFDVTVLSENGEKIRATDAELSNRNTIDKLKYRIPEIESLIYKAISRIIRENKNLNIVNITELVYNSEMESYKQLDETIYNDEIERLFGYPIPIAIWEELISHKHLNEETNQPVLYEELEDIAKNIESEYYEQKSKDEINKLDFKIRYKLGHFDRNNIFECFGFCWSQHPTKNELLISDTYKGLILRLHDYRFNANPPEHIKFFNTEWINEFLKVLVSEGFAVVHPKNYTPFTLDNLKVALIKAKRQPYKYGSFEKIVKHIKHYIYLMQKYKIISYNEDVKFIDAKDFVNREVNKTGYTRREHSLTIDEFKELCATDFASNRLNTARDMFIIATLGGGLRGEEFYGDELSVEKLDGRYVLHIYRSKTQTIEINPAFGELEKVIQRNNDKLPEFISELDLRRSLKEIAESMNFDRTIFSPNTFLDSAGGQIKDVLKEIFSIYFARKTFITMLDAKGMSDDDIIEFSSHSKVGTLKHYKGNLSLSNKFKLIDKLNLGG